MNPSHSETSEVNPELARRVASKLTGGEILLLYGELGAGKTTFVGWLAEALGIEPGLVSSPSYTLVQPYPPGEKGIGILHVDLYRLEREAELDNLGLEDYLDSHTVMVVEWPELGETVWKDFGRPVLMLYFSVDEDGVHRAEMTLPPGTANRKP